MIQTSSKIYIAGHQGMVGSAIARHLRDAGHQNILGLTHHQMDLTNQGQVEDFFAENRPEFVVLAAAKVGGIHANNTYPAEFIYSNLMIETSIIDVCYRYGVKRLLFLGSSCIYPRAVPQPMRENALLTGVLEKTNEPYAIAKIAGIKLCESYNRQYGTDFRSVMPTNLYGPGDNFHPINSHVIPALVRRIHEAKIRQQPEVVIWGSGRAMREFLHVDDMAAACVHVLSLPQAVYQAHTHPMLSHINIGTGLDCSIRELAETLKKVINYSGKLVFDPGKPDGTLRKLLDVSLLKKLGWTHRINLEQGLIDTYRWFLAHEGEIRA